jgi:hypothetical protein
LYIALDANFRLRRRDVSSEEKDPGFMKGWAFFGEVTKYMAHLEKHAGQIQEVSTPALHGLDGVVLTQNFSEVLASPTMRWISPIRNRWGQRHQG